MELVDDTDYNGDFVCPLVPLLQSVKRELTIMVSVGDLERPDPEGFRPV